MSVPQETRMTKAIPVLTIAISLGVASATHAQVTASEATLRVTQETFVGAVKTGNLALLQGLIHPQALGFFWDSQMLVELRAGFGPADALPPVIADISRSVATTYATTYRVVGDTGIVCMTSNRVPKPGEKQVAGYYRSTYVYIWSGQGWKLLSWHSSETPLKR